MEKIEDMQQLTPREETDLRWRWTQKIIKIQILLKAYLESISPRI